MLGPGKTHKVLNILGILGIFVSFVLTVTFNFVAGSGKSEFLLIVQNLMGHFFLITFVNSMLILLTLQIIAYYHK